MIGFFKLRGLGWTGVLAVLGGAALFLEDDAEAGNIFMKNGYILQGPLVEANDEAVVLGYEDGEVTIYHRFIENVKYDPGELESIAQRRRERLRDEEERSGFLVDSRPVRSGNYEELPADLDVFLAPRARELRGAEGVVSTLTPEPEVATPDPIVEVVEVEPEPAVEVATPVEVEPPVEVEVGVDPVEQPELASRVSGLSGKVSLHAPVGWSRVDHDGASFVLVAPRGASLSVVELPFEDGSLPDSAAKLEAEERERLEDYTVLSRLERTLGEATVEELVCRGTLEGKSQEFRRFLFPHGDKLWLVSSHAADDAAWGEIDAALDTLRFAE